MYNFYALFILNVIVVVHLWNGQREKSREIISISRDNIDMLRSGDIILFRHAHASLVTFMFGDEFSHAGLVYEDHSHNKYVLENNSHVDYSDFMGNKKDGVRITPIWTRLSTYNGLVCISPLNIELCPTRKKLFDKLVNGYLGTTVFSYNKANYIKNCVLVMGTGFSSNTINCGMFIAQVLQDLQIIKITTNAVCLRPQCFADLYKHAVFIDGYNYGKTVKLAFT